MLVPPPYAGQHDRFLKNYQATRQRKILNTTRLIVAWHKQRNIFPITLTASVVSQVCAARPTRPVHARVASMMAVPKEVSGW